MAFMDHFLPLLSSLLIGAVVSHAGLLPSQVYWHSALPNTPMPSAISALLAPDALLDSKTTAVNVGRGGVNVKAGTGKPGSTSVSVGKDGVHVIAGKGTNVGVGKDGVHVIAGKGTNVGVGKGGVHVIAGKGKPGSTTVGVGKGGVHVRAGNSKPGSTGVNVGQGGVGVHVQPKYGRPPVIVGVPGKSPFYYTYSATETQLHDDPRVMFFFLEGDLHPGSKMNLQFVKTNKDAQFLSKSEAEETPFSLKKLPEITKRFSIEYGSAEEAAVKQTLEECETSAIKGEKKICATSLESMVDFTVSSLATKDIRAVSTTVYGKDDTPRQEYTIVSSGVRNIAKDELVACHQQPYMYAVFYCHMAKSTKGYTVKMTGKYGTLVDAVAVCHADTSGWNPKHVAFRFLKVKPGTVPVCHFLPQDHVVFARNS
ncbi:hypothetical protein LUZ60_000526 [Juncus effusus]|nr:hypothetical protein LUZ60_000526 [Juncus effusus]